MLEQVEEPLEIIFDIVYHPLRTFKPQVRDIAIIGRMSGLLFNNLLIRGFMQGIYWALSLEYSAFQSLFCRPERWK
jgi:hypothetical protein